MIDIHKRFWDKVPMREEGKCWLWHGGVSGNGYGKFKYKEHSHNAHRIAFMIINGSIPDGCVVCHSCDNKRCVNPSHLFLGTTQDNVTDKVNKERHARGSSHGMSTLKEEDVYAIRDMLDDGARNIDVANHYNISRSLVSKIKTGAKWKHLL